MSSLDLRTSRSPGLNNETLLAEIACMLIDAGANVNQMDKDHFTPLIYGKRAFEANKIDPFPFF